MLSLAQKVFMLVVTVFGLVDLFAYKDLKITQYKIYDKRQDDKEFNFGELYGNFVLGLYDTLTDSFVPFDPKFGTLSIM